MKPRGAVEMWLTTEPFLVSVYSRVSDWQNMLHDMMICAMLVCLDRERCFLVSIEYFLGHTNVSSLRNIYEMR